MTPYWPPRLPGRTVVRPLTTVCGGPQQRRNRRRRRRRRRPLLHPIGEGTALVSPHCHRHRYPRQYPRHQPHGHGHVRSHPRSPHPHSRCPPHCWRGDYPLPPARCGGSAWPTAGAGTRSPARCRPQSPCRTTPWQRRWWGVTWAPAGWAGPHAHPPQAGQGEGPCRRQARLARLHLPPSLPRSAREWPACGRGPRPSPPPPPPPPPAGHRAAGEGLMAPSVRLPPPRPC